VAPTQTVIGQASDAVPERSLRSAPSGSPVDPPRFSHVAWDCSDDLTLGVHLLPWRQPGL